ncbi:MAG: peptidylprolyl isomerase [Ruminococcus sp.]|nr:peptidylprolyl isomerase [Ruminococcus sp.]
MKKKILILGVCTVMLCGCGKIPKLSNGDEAVVTFKDGAISANDFYEEIKNNYGLTTLVDMIDKYVYERELKDKTEEAKTYAASAVKAFKSSYESETEALQMLQAYYRYQTFDAYETKMYINYLQSEAIEKYVADNISEDDLKKYYETDVYPDMTISHILIKPAVTTSMTSDEKEKAENEAKDKINNLIEELNKAKKDGEDVSQKFSNLARSNSEDDSTKDKGGSLGEINIGSLDTTYDELIKAAAKLNDGEYSTSLITTEAGYHIIYKANTKEKASYEDSLDSMKERITNERLSDSENGQKLMVEAVKHYREKYELDIVDSEIDSQYGRYMNNLINSN